VKKNDTGTDGDIGKRLIVGKSSVMRRFRFRRLTAAHVRCSLKFSQNHVALRSCQITFDFSRAADRQSRSGMGNPRMSAAYSRRISLTKRRVLVAISFG
jgi:hypothetical protein